MIRHTILTAAFAAALTIGLSSSALAQKGQGDGPQKKRALPERVQEFDKDGNGRLDETERKAAGESRNAERGGAQPDGTRREKGQRDRSKRQGARKGRREGAGEQGRGERGRRPAARNGRRPNAGRGTDNPRGGDVRGRNGRRSEMRRGQRQGPRAGREGEGRGGRRGQDARRGGAKQRR